MFANRCPLKASIQHSVKCFRLFYIIDIKAAIVGDQIMQLCSKVLIKMLSKIKHRELAHN